MLGLMLLLQVAVDDRVGAEVTAFCRGAPPREQAACARRQTEAAARTYAAATIGDDTTPAAIGRCLETSRRHGIIDWTRAATCAHAYARAHPAPS